MVLAVTSSIVKNTAAATAVTSAPTVAHLIGEALNEGFLGRRLGLRSEELANIASILRATSAA